MSAAARPPTSPDDPECEESLGVRSTVVAIGG